MSMIAYFCDEDDARQVAERLRAGGFKTRVERGSFAGEDDDEDQPWMLTTDAPDLVVEVAAEDAGGWVEHHRALDQARPPLPLPGEPIRSREG